MNDALMEWWSAKEIDYQRLPSLLDMAEAAWDASRALVLQEVAASGEAVVYQCPRCATSMEIGPSAKPAAPDPRIAEYQRIQDRDSDMVNSMTNQLDRAEDKIAELEAEVQSLLALVRRYQKEIATDDDKLAELEAERDKYKNQSMYYFRQHVELPVLTDEELQEGYTLVEGMRLLLGKKVRQIEELQAKLDEGKKLALDCLDNYDLYMKAIALRQWAEEE